MWPLRNDIRPWQKHTVMRALHDGIFDAATKRGLPLKRYFYSESPNNFYYLFDKQAAVYSNFRTFPLGETPFDVHGAMGGSRYKAWFYPIVLVTQSSNEGRRIIDTLLADFDETMSRSISLAQMRGRQ